MGGVRQKIILFSTSEVQGLQEALSMKSFGS